MRKCTALGMVGGMLKLFFKHEQTYLLRVSYTITEEAKLSVANFDERDCSKKVCSAH